MIPRTHATRQTPAWQTALAVAITDPEELLRALELDPCWLPGARAAAAIFPLRVPRGYVARMRKSDPYDPLLRQVLPLGEELDPAAGYGSDPVGDLASAAVPGMLHKYAGRALVISTGACPVHCRYCFRRHFPYADHALSAEHRSATLHYLAGDETLSEVILSGGDPLVLSDQRLGRLIDDFASIPHLRRIRLHSRTPIVLPERVDDGLLAVLRHPRLKFVLVTHANHASEIDAPVIRALRNMADAGITMLNQSVLLRGVNDDPEALAALSEALFDAGVLPYYLHTLDRVAGAAHFEVPDERAREIMTALRARLPGYLVPRLVREQQGAASKTTIF